jgi:hypothetical protein
MPNTTFNLKRLSTLSLIMCRQIWMCMDGGVGFWVVESCDGDLGDGLAAAEEDDDDGGESAGVAG